VQQFRLTAGGLGGHRHVHGRAPEVAVPFWDLVRQVELVTEDGGDDLAYRPVILMRVVPGRRDDDIGRARLRQPFENLFHAAPHRGQAPLRQVEEVDVELGLRHEGPGRVPCLLVAFRRARQDGVTNPGPASAQA
jgi:hypothetical protein